MTLETKVIAQGQVIEKPSSLANAKEIASRVPVGTGGGSFLPSFSTMSEVIEFAQLMASSTSMIGAAFRGNPSACLGITMQAARLGMDPFALSQKAYLIKDSIGYEAQAVISMIYASAIVEGRIRYAFEGTGAARVCAVTIKFKGDPESVVHRSPPFSQIQPKNSPLWKSDPDQQQSYYTARAAARLHAPDVLMGVYTCEEREYAQGNQSTNQTGIELLTKKLTEDAEKASGPEPEKPAKPDRDNVDIEDDAIKSIMAETEIDKIDMHAGNAEQELDDAGVPKEISNDILIRINQAGAARFAELTKD